MSIAVHKEETLTNIEDSISKAMEKVGVRNPNQLCKFIPFEGGHLHHFTMEKLKKTNRDRLEEMLKTHILNKESPKVFPAKTRKPYKKKYRTPQYKKTLDRNSLEGCIALAMQRKNLKLNKENDLCRYLPTEEGKRLHYLAFKKMRKSEPNKLKAMIEKYLLIPKRPQLIQSARVQKELSPSKETPINPSLTEKLVYSIDQLIHTLRNKNTPYSDKKENSMNLLQRSLKAVQFQLIQSIQNKGIDPELWETYVLMVKEMY